MNTRKGAPQRLFLCLLAILACLPGATSASDCPATRIDQIARVKYVHDGDTLQLQDGQKVRLIGIDTPELARNRQPAQPFADQARTALRRLIEKSGRHIKLQYGSEHRDRYGRILAHIFDRDGQNLNAALLSRGLAIAYTTPPNDRLSQCYQQLDFQAQADAAGFWQHPRYRVIPGSELLDADDGFHRLRVTIDKVKLSDDGGWLSAGALGIHIRDHDMVNFETSWLESLAGRSIIVRGWLRKDRYKPRSKRYLALRHPSAIESTQKSQP